MTVWEEIGLLATRADPCETPGGREQDRQGKAINRS
jgi:hypothetical protein